MITALLQVTAALLALAFSLLALAVALRREGLSYVRRAAWIIVSVFFLWRTVPGVLQSLTMYWGLEAGPGTGPYSLVVRWGPAMNYLRTFVAVAMGWTLAALPLLRGQPLGRLWWGSSVACLALAASGVYVGWLEGPISPSHVISLTVLSATELIGLLAALMVGLLANTLDRYLWIILGVYALQVALSVMWYSSTVGFFYPGGWYPPPAVRHAFSSIAYLTACTLAWYRLVLARRGVPVADLFEEAGGGIFPSPRPRA